MPNVVGILTFISRINTASECFIKQDEVVTLQLKVYCLPELSMKKFFNLGAATVFPSLNLAEFMIYMASKVKHQRNF